MITMINVPGLWFIFGFVIHARPVACFFATNSTVLLAQAKGVIPNAFGPVKAKVSTEVVLTLEFSVVAGKGYGAGAVTATTDSSGRLVRLVKQRQACSIAYAPEGSVRSVKCSGARQLAQPASNATGATHPNVAQQETGMAVATVDGSGLLSQRRLASSTCASCAALLFSALTYKFNAVCGALFPRLIPSRYRWPKSAVAAICGMNKTLGDPIDLAYRTCRCCIEGSDCTSGVCSDGLCLARKLMNGEPCPDFEDEDCQNGRCALDSFPSGRYVCCESNEYIPYRDYETYEYYCVQDDGAPCGTDRICKGGYCARISYPSGEHVCCRGSKVYSPTHKEYFCTSIQATGSECDSDELCTSGVCSGGVCLAQKLGSGQACPDNDDGDCANSACARGSYPSGEHVCCPRGSKVYSPTHKQYFCTGIQATGSECDSNGICYWGVCSEGVCLSRRIRIGQPCPDKEDGDCANSACARGSYPSGEHVCCPSGDTVYSPTHMQYFCTGIQATGSECESNDICTSGVCSEGVCLAQKLGSGQACPDKRDEDCTNFDCARGSYPSGEYVCCPTDRKVYSSTHKAYFCAGLAAGSECGSNEMCTSGACLGGFCLAQKLGPGQACPDRDIEDCASNACARGSYPSGEYVCCPSGRHFFSSARNDTFCAGLQTGSSCGLNRMCDSGVCSGGICLAQKLGPGQPCPDNENEDCTSGACSGGVCLAQKIKVGQPCPENDGADCESGSCARRSYLSLERICCSHKFYSETHGDYFCPLGIGSRCESHYECSSRACSGFVCIA